MNQRRYLLAAAALLIAAVAIFLVNRQTPAHAFQAVPRKERRPAPELEGGIAWLNTAGPLKLQDLKGKIVLLDFWTLCCINCIHIMPDLAKLEQKYANELVVIGVHSAKFESEKETKNIRQAILRYEIAHPVVNDAEHKIWNRYGVNSWPTQVLIDPEGNFVGSVSGEGNYEAIDAAIAKLIEEHKKKGTLTETPMRFDLIRYRDVPDTPLFFPGKVLADGPSNRLFIADSTHHRVIVATLEGETKLIAGTGSPGFKDGPAAQAQFDDPQGLALEGDTLYIADRKNHAIRAWNLATGQVATIAGTGQQQGGFANRMIQAPVEARTTGLNSPWDLWRHGRQLFIAMAGHHQIWVLDLDAGKLRPFAGSGREDIKDGPLYAANFAQPSGLASDGTNLFVADCEVSAIRKLPLSGQGRVTTLVGEGLFEFGDVDGAGPAARLQHALGVAWHDGVIYIADTYNNKIKTLDPKTRQCTTWLGDGTDSILNEPAGLSIANGKLYVADTNAHRIRVVDLATKSLSSLELKGLEPPPRPRNDQP